MIKSNINLQNIIRFILCDSMFDLINDNNGFVSLTDALLSIFILFMVLIAFNMVADIEIPSLS